MNKNKSIALTEDNKTILDNVYDAYNKKMLSDEICGTITSHGHLGWRNVGTYLVIDGYDVEIHDEADRIRIYG